MAASRNFFYRRALVLEQVCTDISSFNRAIWGIYRRWYTGPKSVMWAKQYGKNIHLGIVYTIYKKWWFLGDGLLLLYPHYMKPLGPRWISSKSCFFQIALQEESLAFFNVWLTQKMTGPWMTHKFQTPRTVQLESLQKHNIQLQYIYSHWQNYGKKNVSIYRRRLSMIEKLRTFFFP